MDALLAVVAGAAAIVLLHDAITWLADRAARTEGEETR